jgi:1-acyl-sn-glycerol-3-phosphate acyltransferase
MGKYKDPFLYRILRPIGNVLFRILYRPKIIGKDYIPKSGRIVLAGNHKNNLDCMMVLCSTKRCVHFLAKEELFKGPFGWFFKAIGLIPVKRKTKDGKALPESINYLENEKVIGIFPEATFNRGEGVILPFKIGAVKMAHDTNTKIVPFVIKGEYKLFRKRARIIFFKPFDVKSDDLDKENKKFMKFIENKLTDSEV